MEMTVTMKITVTGNEKAIEEAKAKAAKLMSLMNMMA